AVRERQRGGQGKKVDRLCSFSRRGCEDMVAQSVRENAGWQTSGWQSERCTKVSRDRQRAQWQATRPVFQFGGDSMSTEATNEWNTDAIRSLRQPEEELPEMVSAERFLETRKEMSGELVGGRIAHSA